MPKIIKQYGLERSGTNYIKALIEINSDALVLSTIFGSKHWKYSKIQEDYDPFKYKSIITDLTHDQILYIKNEFLNNNVKYLISIKNPYSWIVSYREYCQNHNYKIDDSAERLIKIWNRLNNNWINNLSENNHYLVNYDKLISNPGKEINNIFLKFSISFNTEFTDIINSMTDGCDYHGSKNISDYRFDKKKYYLNSEYLSKLSEHDLDIIEEYADKNILSVLHSPD